MIRVAIAEDMQFERDALLKCIRRYEQERGEVFSCTVFENGEELLRGYEKGFDILLLDVAMPKVDGLTAARRIRRQDDRAIIIFITSMVQYAVQGYSVDALDFIVKPVGYTGLKLRLDRALAKIAQSKPKRLEVRSANGLCSVAVNDIRYVETYNHKIIIHTADAQLLTDRPMKQIEEELSGQPFFRCHTSYLVNFRFVDRVQGYDIEVDGQMLPISRYRRRELMDAWAAYLGDHI
ncbi:MAG: LytTR family DNA-binding domain-containing protein [Clostridia bacterium]|nr:LytTR family DNA-binding domain-containing protein [Clostridia bacterium]